MLQYKRHKSRGESSWMICLLHIIYIGSDRRKSQASEIYLEVRFLVGAIEEVEALSYTQILLSLVTIENGHGYGSWS